jgi:hypothetical protein
VDVADKRLGIDVFESPLLPAAQKRHVTINSDLHGYPPSSRSTTPRQLRWGRSRSA